MTNDDKMAADFKIDKFVFTDDLFLSFTTDERQAWMNYENKGNEYLIVEAIVRSEYSNI